MSENAFSPPDGFELMTKRGPFTSRNGPFYSREREGGVEQAFLAETRHCNSMGIVHGGMYAAFVDGLLANAAGKAAGRGGVTVHLSIDYLGMAREGDWVVGEAEASRLTRDLAFVEARVRVEDRPVIRASGVFKLNNRDR